ncbi:ABC transporter ATP-binding protein [Lysinibacillus sp. FSL K6-0232]|uniref:ABC transporter ATP-binding protein n=1 Tax=unclassified Lysinibacillus TaxID=2636778 RepID=UPI0030FB575F
MMNPLLQVDALTIKLKEQYLVQNVHFDLHQHQCLGIVGESGSGKSITCKAIMGLLPQNFTTDGQIWWDNKNLLEASPSEIRALRGNDISMILQNPMTAFNPIFTIGNQMQEMIRAHLQVSKGEALEMACAALSKMLLKQPEVILKKYPHELSGGMLQRIMIANALVLNPSLIIADEPTTALDAVTQKEVMYELQQLQQELDSSMIIISHDLAVVANLAQDVLVMNHGQQVEHGSVEQIFANPKDDYTRYLLNTKLAMLKKYESVLGGI